MLIPIGFFGGAAEGSYELISTAYGTGSSNTISFTSIPQTYQHLQIRMTAQSNGSGYADIWLRLNGDSTSIKPFSYTEGNGSSVSSTASQTATFGNYLGRCGLQSQESTGVAPTIVDIPNYKASRFKIVKSFNGVSFGQIRVGLFTSLWQDTSAVSSFNIVSDNSNFSALTRVSLYGLKG